MKKIFVISLVLASVIFGQETLDKVVAVVGDEIILKSELMGEASYYAAPRGLDPSDPALLDQLLNMMIEQKLLYTQAKRDSVVISDEQIKQQIDYQLNYLVQQQGSEKRIEEIYGMPIEKIRRQMRDETRKQLMAQTIRNQKFGMLDVTRGEVKEFFNTYKDSLGLIPEKFKLAHIFINPKATGKVKEEARKKTELLLDSIKAGADFAELARENSDDPGSASQGGDLGFVKRGVFFPEYESAAFALEEGELSGVVESPVGFHIIQLLERRGESIHTRHILIKPKADDQADLKSIEFLSDLRDSILNGDSTFSYYAKKYSDDKESAPKGGKLGTFELSQLDESMKKKVYDMEVGDISFPKRLELNKNTYGFHIVKLLARTPEHKPTLDGDYEELKQLAEYQKREKLYKEWVSKLKDNIYWDIRL